MGEKMVKSEISIKMDMKQFMDRFGGNYADWCVGVTSSDDPRLLEMAHSKAMGKWWIFNTASSGSVAKYVAGFLQNLGADAEEIAEHQQSKVIYAYKKAC